MKCIRCGHDSKYPERRQKKCPNCQGAFAFEPREGDVLTDTAFHNAIEAVSAHGAVRWTVDNLYYEICRRKRRFMAPVYLIVTLAIAIGVTATFGAKAHPGWFLVTLVIAGATAVAVVSRFFPNPLVNVARIDFHGMYDRWCQVHGTPPGVIVRQPQPRVPKHVEPDVGDYSFDRAVICDRDTTVDLLVANNFHFENNCAVLSIDGYPPGPFETVKAMLKRNPKLEVFALHDASPKGCALAHQLATDPAWFAGGIKVVDVGLRPRHAGPFAGLLQEAKAGPPLKGPAVTAEEAEWLAKYVLELAAIRPEQVLKRLYRAINRKAQPAASARNGGGGDGYVFIASGGDGGGVLLDGDSFGTDATDADGGGDSFG